MREFFTAKDLGNGILRLEGKGAVGMYLVLGEKKAALLDTGVGIGNLQEYVRQVTDLPVEVYLTHGHLDHAGGIYSFPRVWMNAKDLPILERNTRKARLDYGNLIRSVFPEKDGWTEEDVLGQWDIPVNGISPGDVIDLGGRTLTVVDFAGHTAGSVGFYDNKTRSLFCGDGCNNSTFLFLKESLPLMDYRNTLQKLKADWWDRVDHMIICHDYDEVPRECLNNVMECAEKILQGTDDKEEFRHPNPEFNGLPVRWAAKGGAHRNDGKFGNIAYDYTRI